MSTSVHKRSSSLRSGNYGGAGDWELLYQFDAKEASEIESYILSLFEYFKKYNKYYKGNKIQYSYELLEVGLSNLHKRIKGYIEKNNIEITNEFKSGDWSSYA